MLTFHVPSGLGDISWCYSKVSELSKHRNIGFHICGDQPRRSLPYVEILPRITNLGYSNLSYAIHIEPNLLQPGNTNLAALKDGTYYLGLNPWLEAGHPLAKAFPAQATDYHYPMHLPEPSSLPAVNMLRSIPQKKIGFYCSSNRHRLELGMWVVSQWVDFLKKIKAKYPDCVFVAIGAPYDDKTAQVADVLSRDCVVHKFVNQPPWQTFRIMETLNYFFAFPSGLGIMADVLRVPCMMWFWGNLPDWRARMGGLFNAYADPATLASGFHIVAPYDSVDGALALFLTKGVRHVR